MKLEENEIAEIINISGLSFEEITKVSEEFREKKHKAKNFMELNFMEFAKELLGEEKVRKATEIVTEDLNQKDISPEVQSNSSFKKFDSGKIDYSLLEPIVVEMYCSVSQMGAKKYGRNNWKQSKKEDMYRYEAALLRHLMAYKSGEKKDPESGLSHLSHALWNLVALETKERE